MTIIDNGQTYRNINRYNSRNTSFIRALETELGRPAHNFYYQYCGSFECREITAIITSENLDAVVFEGFISLGKILNVPVLSIFHAPHDDDLKYPLSVRMFAEEYELQNNLSSWRDIAHLLRSLQKDHENKTNRCNTHYKNLWGSKGKGKSNADVDFSVSNMLRAVPGVRHLDMDYAFWCDDCCAPLAFVEASSTGSDKTKYAHLKKTVSMTQKIARQVSAHSLLIQHPLYLDNEVLVSAWNGDDQYLDKDYLSLSRIACLFARLKEVHHCS